MKACPKCKVNINSVRKTCPLCGEILTEINKEGTDTLLYPKYVPATHSPNLLLRILLFISFVVSFVSVLINLLTYKGDLWSFYVLVGVGYAWILLRSTILSRKNIAGRLLIQMLAVSTVVLVIEKVSHTSGWALDYVVPFICIVTTLAIVILILSKQMRYNDYLLYLLVSILVSFVPLILYWFDKIKVFWPSITAAALAFVITIGMIVFADRVTKDELRKRFHL